jgi:hypothetical protein
MVMRTIVLGANPDIEAVIARRRSLGQDLFDEVWEGEYHMAPVGTGAHAILQVSVPLLLQPFAAKAGLIASGPFNLGHGDDFRVPDLGYHRTKPVGVWHDTAAIVVEIVSPDDETYAKFDFYLAHGVDEIIVADPAEKSVRCFQRTATGFADSEQSLLLGVDAAYITTELDWP